MSDPAAKVVRFMFAWKKVFGGAAITILSAAGGWGWSQWEAQTERIDANTTAIVAATQQAALDRAIITQQLASTHTDIHDLKDDVRDIRNALMIRRGTGTASNGFDFYDLQPVVKTP